MARRTPRLAVAITATAQRELIRIWDYNAENRDVRQADAWDLFLRSKIDGLATSYDKGKPVENFPELKHVTVKKRPKAHGHIVVYEIDSAANVVNILHVFHTSQDVQGRLKSEFE